MRTDLEPIPERMSGLALDPDRGYPVPWFVAWVDGKPEFRAMDPEKYKSAIQKRLCWVCGGKLGVNMCFVAGPMCGINRTSSEPPSHVECGRWSARNCPFLSNPHMVRREDDVLNNQKLAEMSPGFAIARNPGVAMLWITRSYEIFKIHNGYLIQMGDPESVEWYCEGKPATRDQVIRSIETGIHNLEAVARQEKGGIEALLAARSRFEAYIPA